MTGSPPLTPVRLGPWSKVTPRPRAVFLDRDGVLNAVGGDGTRSLPPRSVAELRIADDAPEAVQSLRDAGFALVVVTNQPDVARGTISASVARSVTNAVASALALDDAYVCEHDTADLCPCRKPRPGMLLAAAIDWGVDLGQSWMIGDRWVDVVAGLAAGARSVLLERPYSWDASGGSEPPTGLDALPRFPRLGDCVEYVLANSTS